MDKPMMQALCEAMKEQNMLSIAAKMMREQSKWRTAYRPAAPTTTKQGD